MRLTYEEFKVALLNAMHRDANVAGWTNFQELQDKYDMPVTGLWSPQAMEELTAEGLIEARSGGAGNAYSIFGRLTQKGIQSVNSAIVVSASDRIVSLDHNQKEYLQIAYGLKSIRECVRGANLPTIDPLERERIINSLDSASKLWETTQLKIIQIKVGVLMAVDDASKALASTAQAVAAALLVDVIKAFVKNHLGIDLDKI